MGRVVLNLNTTSLKYIDPKIADAMKRPDPPTSGT